MNCSSYLYIAPSPLYAFDIVYIYISICSSVQTDVRVRKYARKHEIQFTKRFFFIYEEAEKNYACGSASSRLS